jgi:hypothetical protein
MREVPIGLCSFDFCEGACECVDNYGTDSEGESLPLLESISDATLQNRGSIHVHWLFWPNLHDDIMEVNAQDPPSLHDELEGSLALLNNETEEPNSLDDGANGALNSTEASVISPSTYELDPHVFIPVITTYIPIITYILKYIGKSPSPTSPATRRDDADSKDC